MWITFTFLSLYLSSYYEKTNKLKLKETEILKEKSTFTIGFILTLIFFSPIFIVSSGEYIFPKFLLESFSVFIYILVAFSIASTLVLTIKKCKIDVNKIDILFFFFGMYLILNYFLIGYGDWANGKFIWWLCNISSYFVVKFTFKKLPFESMIAGLIVIGIIQMTIAQLQLIGYVPSNHGLFKITGTFFNPAPLAGFVAVIFPIALFIALCHKAGGTRTLSFVYLFFSLLILIPADSRASYIAVAGSSFLVLCERFKLLKYLKRIEIKRKVIFLLSFLILLSGSLYYLIQSRPLSVVGRILIWKISIINGIDNFFLGNGLTSFSSKYNLDQSDYFRFGKSTELEVNLADTISFAYNESIQIFYELGFVGLLIWVILLLVLYFTVFTQSESKELKAIGFAVTSWLLFSSFSYPLDVLGTSIILVFLLAIASANTPPMFVPNSQQKAMTLLILICICLLLVYWNIVMHKSHMEFKMALELYDKRQYTQARKIYEKDLAIIERQGFYLQNKASCLSQVKEFESSNLLLDVAKKTRIDYQLYIIMSENYASLGEFSKAEECLYIALYMVPNRLYPRFLLWKLYVKFDQKEQAISKAREIFEMKPKIQSRAVTEMKTTVTNYLSEIKNAIE